MNSLISITDGGAVIIPPKTLLLLLTIVSVLLALQGITIFNKGIGRSTRNSLFQQRSVVVPDSEITVTTLRGSDHHLKYESSIWDYKNDNSTIVKESSSDDDQCRWYLAESAIPQGGLGLFTARGLLPNDMVGFPDICIYVSDPPDHWTHLRSHTWGHGTFFGQFESEGRNSRAACEGFTTTYNTVPDNLVNTEIISPVLPTIAGQHRATSPGAGSSTHHFGVHGRAKTIISAGSELTINYGDWDFTKRDEERYSKPIRPVDWLRKYGWCIDNIVIKRSTIPDAGRGAFARVTLEKGQIIAPAPLQIFQNRSVFQTTNPEQLIVNYCLQPARDSDMIVYPYGAAVNLINHNHYKPNVAWQWSSKTHIHHAAWLDLDYENFWNVVKPGGLVLEIVALRPIAAGEELYLDYGSEWEQAWQQHVQRWKPVANAQSYIYPADMDETTELRTVEEQITNPYPSNIATVCNTPVWRDQRRGTNDHPNHLEWYQNTDYNWNQMSTFCHIMNKTIDRYTKEYVYTVNLIFQWNHNDKISNYTYVTSTTPYKDQYIDINVPRHAIRFIEKPYEDDEHLPNAFRHPMILPDHLVPSSWRNSNIPKPKQQEQVNETDKQ